VPGQAATAQSIERGFASRPIEGASGLVYMRARHYDPTTGRFLQPDPEGIASTQRYATADQNSSSLVSARSRVFFEDPCPGGPDGRGGPGAFRCGLLRFPPRGPEPPLI